MNLRKLSLKTNRRVQDEYEGKVVTSYKGKTYTGFIFAGELFVNDTPTGIEASADDESEVIELIKNYVK